MAKIFDSIDRNLKAWIEEQPMWFVATAPLGTEGHVNMSPRGHDSFSVLGAHRVGWVDYTGSGIETMWHPDNAAYGQCGSTALIDQDLLGGDLLIADVSGGIEENEVRYWDRFPGGLEIDLTREQFRSHRIIGSPASSSDHQKGHGHTPASTSCFAQECRPR